MEKYEILKLNYLRKIRKDKTFFERMVELQEQEETKEIADIVLHPKNERQLILAEAFHTFFNAMIYLKDGINYEEMEDGYLNDNFGVSTYVRLIRQVREGKTDSHSFWEAMSPYDRAKANYWLFLANGFNPLGTAKYIGEQVGKDFNYFHAQEELYEYTNKLGVVEEYPFENMDFDDETQVMKAAIYAQEFERLVKNGRKRKGIAGIIDTISRKVGK